MGKEYGKGKHGIGFKIGVASAVGIVVIVLAALAGSLFSSDTGTGSADLPFGGLTGATVVPSDEDGGVVSRGGVTVTTIDDGCQDYRVNIRDLKIIRTSIIAGTSEKPVSGARFKITYWVDKENKPIPGDAMLYMAPSIEDLKKDEYPRRSSELRPGKLDEKLKYSTTFAVKTETPVYIWIIYEGKGSWVGSREFSYIYRIDV